MRRAAITPTRTWRGLAAAGVLPLALLSAAGKAPAADYRLQPLGPAAASAPGFSAAVDLAQVALKAGDRVLLACGQRYGPIKLRLDAGVDGRVQVGPPIDCGKLPSPVIDGRQSLSWLPAGDAAGAHQRAAVAGAVTQVFDGDRPLPRARYPAQGYLLIDATVAPSDQRVPALAGRHLADLDGAVVHARTQEWLIEESVVLGEAGLLATPLRYPLRPKVGMYFSGKSWMLGNQPAWAYDASERSVWVSAPAGASLTASFYGPLLQVAGRGSVTISGTVLLGAGADALDVQLDGNVLVQNLQVRWAAGNGMAFAGARSVQVIDSSVELTGRDAIFLAEVGRAELRGNHVADAGMYLGPGPSLAAINAQRTGAAVIEGNHVQRSAYIGIRFGGDAVVRGNLVEDSCLRLADCAALYTWRRNRQDRRGPVQVSGNAVLRVGMGTDVSVKFGVNDWFAGIYLDEWTRDAAVTGNLVADANQALYLHNAFGNQLQDNLLLGWRVAPLLDLVDAPVRASLASQLPEQSNRVAGNQGPGRSGPWRLLAQGNSANAAGPRWQVLVGVGAGWQMQLRQAIAGGDSQIAGCRIQPGPAGGGPVAFVAWVCGA